jgi:hypothetical protein
MAWGMDMRKMYGDIVKIVGIPLRNDVVFVFNPQDIENVFRNEGPWPNRFILQSLYHFRSKLRPEFFQGHHGIVNE